VQIIKRLPAIHYSGFGLESLCEVGRKVRDLYANQSRVAERILTAADDAYVADLAAAVTGQLGGRVGIAPRVYLKKLVADVLGTCPSDKYVSASATKNADIKRPILNGLRSTTAKGD
jgi:hypothetical protein